MTRSTQVVERDVKIERKLGPIRLKNCIKYFIPRILRSIVEEAEGEG